jgi:hypothetical protein
MEVFSGRRRALLTDSVGTVYRGSLEAPARRRRPDLGVATLPCIDAIFLSSHLVRFAAPPDSPAALENTSYLV